MVLKQKCEFNWFERVQDDIIKMLMKMSKSLVDIMEWARCELYVAKG